LYVKNGETKKGFNMKGIFKRFAESVGLGKDTKSSDNKPPEFNKYTWETGKWSGPTAVNDDPTIDDPTIDAWFTRGWF